MVIGLLCPGQGSQHVGMGRDLVDAFPSARETYAEADDALEFKLSELSWSGPESDLTLTINAQPAILVHSVAVWRVLQEERPLPAAIGAGHSLGEFSAYVAAGAMAFADALRVVRRRGELMHRSGSLRGGTMTAVIGLDDAAGEDACRTATEAGDGVVVPANYNSPGQLVLSGDVEAVRRAEQAASELGAKRVIPLNVSGAFHSPLMEPALEGLREALEAVRIGNPDFPIVSNVTAEPVTDAGEARDLLLRQLTSPVRWAQSIGTMISAGVTEFVEIGPGNVLTGLLRRIDRSTSGRALGSAGQVREYLQKGG